MENSLALNHKLDELIESVKSIPMETNEDNLAKHEYHEQQDLVFQNKDFKSHETTKETFRQLEHSDQINEKDSYELEHEFEMAREGVKILRFKFGLDSKTHDKHIGELDKMADEAENLSPQSTPQVLPSIKVYTPPVTYPKEVEDTIITPLEIEPLDHTKLEDLGLITCSPDIFVSSREVCSGDEPEPQPLPNFPSLDVNLGDKRGTNPPINPYSSCSFRMKIVEPLTIHKPPSPHVAYFYQNSVYRYYHPHLTLSVIFDKESSKVLRIFTWTILRGRFSQFILFLLHYCAKLGEY
nr:ribonuclease H-like domain-containing protein [Tanacetum cinerariifolium]